MHVQSIVMTQRREGLTLSGKGWELPGQSVLIVVDKG